MILHIAIALTLGQEIEISLDQGGSAAKYEGDLGDVHFLGRELRTAGESGQIVGNGFWRVAHDLADLRGGFALQRQLDDLNAVCEHRPDVTEGAAHRDQDFRVRPCGQL